MLDVTALGQFVSTLDSAPIGLRRTHESLNVNIIPVLWIIVFIVTIQLHHPLFNKQSVLLREFTCTIKLQIIDSKCRPTDPPPRIVLGFPCLSVQIWLPPSLFRTLVFDVLAKISTNEIIARVDIKFLQKERNCPRGVLHVEHSQDSVSTSVRLRYL